jgi:hypothetical protein
MVKPGSAAPWPPLPWVTAQAISTITRIAATPMPP